MMKRLWRAALAFRRSREAELKARIQLREKELYSLRTELGALRCMTDQETLLRYVAADPDELERHRQPSVLYIALLRDIFVQANLSGSINTSLWGRKQNSDWKPEGKRVA